MTCQKATPSLSKLGSQAFFRAPAILGFFGESEPGQCILPD
jgi:hypothetical protein